MRILALDPGSRRIGVAVSDPTGSIATPVGTIHRSNREHDLGEIARLAHELEAEQILVGLPIHLSGEEGIEARRAREFGQRIEERTGLPIRFWDERLSTREAERTLIEAGVRRKRRRLSLDAAAAAVILRSYLDSLPRLTTGE